MRRSHPTVLRRPALAVLAALASQTDVVNAAVDLLAARGETVR